MPPRESKAVTTKGRTVLLPLVLLAGGLSGCMGGDEPANPNLLAPKVVFDVASDGSYVVFVHSAIGERRYDRLELLVDNETVAEREDAFSLEHRIGDLPAYVEVRTLSGTTQFHFRAGLQADPDSEEALAVSLVDADGDWAEPRRFSLPFERFLERPPAADREEVAA